MPLKLGKNKNVSPKRFWYDIKGIRSVCYQLKFYLEITHPFTRVNFHRFLQQNNNPRNT
jgi:hypothetical protein